MADEFDEKDERDERDPRSLSSRIEGLVPDTMKRAFYTGLGALFLTEEGVRRQLSEMKFPKDAISYVVGQSTKNKEELFDAIAREIAKMFENVDVEEVLRNAMAGMKLKMDIEVEFQPAGTETSSSPARVRFRTQAKREKE